MGVRLPEIARPPRCSGAGAVILMAAAAGSPLEDPEGSSTWVVVKIMAPFWVLSTKRH